MSLFAGNSFSQEIPAHIAKRDKFFDVEAVGNDVWIVGFPGIILFSGDSGSSFESQSGGLNEALFAVDFIDGKNGWISGSP
ncbi:MAG: hypothetical protein FJ088_13770, partial [Deltaproteobacteria bacterium]|nr:hypothetical protein [Deltaproteobacteria bacterium]